MKNKNLTINEIKFVEEYVANGFNGAKAFRVAFDNDNQNSAKAQAWKLLQKLHIQDAVSATEQSYRSLAREFGMDKKSILMEIKDIIKGEERSAKEKLAGINVLCKLTGAYASQKQDIQIELSESKFDFSKLTIEEIEQKRQELLNEM